jgi:hypothetical protein
MTKKILKVVVFVPTTHADIIRNVLQKVGAGKTKKYEGCSFSTPGLQRFYPRKGSNPFLGKVGKLEIVTEERIETFILPSLKNQLLRKIKKVHPYEEPVIDFYEIESSYDPI